MSLNKFNIGVKIWIPVITLAILSTVIAVFSLYEMQSVLMAERIAKTRNIVQASKSIAGYYKSLEDSGALTHEQATQQARNVIRAMRYDGNNYAFAYDDKGMRLISPDITREGVPALDAQDKHGTYYIPDLIARAKEGGGKTSYYWPRVNGTEALEKLAWTEYFAPWGWVLGSGTYIDDVQAAFRSQALEILAFALIGGALAGIAAVLVIRNVSGPLKKLTGNMQTLAQGNTDIVIEGTDRRDEIGTLDIDLGIAVREFAHALGQVLDRPGEIADRREGDSERQQTADGADADDLDRFSPERVFDVINIDAGAEHPAPGLKLLRPAQLRQGHLSALARNVIRNGSAAGPCGGQHLADLILALGILGVARVLAFQRRLGRDDADAVGPVDEGIVVAVVTHGADGIARLGLRLFAGELSRFFQLVVVSRERDCQLNHGAGLGDALSVKGTRQRREAEGGQDDEEGSKGDHRNPDLDADTEFVQGHSRLPA